MFEDHPEHLSSLCEIVAPRAPQRSMLSSRAPVTSAVAPAQQVTSPVISAQPRVVSTVVASPAPAVVTSAGMTSRVNLVLTSEGPNRPAATSPPVSVPVASAVASPQYPNLSTSQLQAAVVSNTPVDEDYLRDLTRSFLVIGRDMSEGKLYWLAYKLLVTPQPLDTMIANLEKAASAGGIPATRGAADRVIKFQKAIESASALATSRTENVAHVRSQLDVLHKLLDKEFPTQNIPTSSPAGDFTMPAYRSSVSPAPARQLDAEFGK
mmetsp:Transcript_46788/g.101623  ORF Transcript_46788/g.101623 Transcript_46788/m.101623 type:complete len:266 (-) Transcript_46788:70-867(-)